jgi:hypothetical protein
MTKAVATIEEWKNALPISVLAANDLDAVILVSDMVDHWAITPQFTVEGKTYEIESHKVDSIVHLRNIFAGRDAVLLAIMTLADNRGYIVRYKLI